MVFLFKNEIVWLTVDVDFIRELNVKVYTDYL